MILSNYFGLALLVGFLDDSIYNFFNDGENSSTIRFSIQGYIVNDDESILDGLEVMVSNLVI